MVSRETALPRRPSGVSGPWGSRIQWRPKPRSSSPARAGNRGDGRLAAVFVAPALLGFVVFLLWPTLRGVYLSFTRFNLLTPAEWVGLDNYVRMVHDPVFWDSLRVTVVYVVISIGVQTVSALAVFRAQTPQTGTDWSGLMAATLIAALPMLLLFGVFARRIVGTIGFTGVK